MPLGKCVHSTGVGQVHFSPALLSCKRKTALKLVVKSLEVGGVSSPLGNL